jgi:hypothetical protein
MSPPSVLCSIGSGRSRTREDIGRLPVDRFAVTARRSAASRLRPRLPLVIERKSPTALPETFPLK